MRYSKGVVYFSAAENDNNLDSGLSGTWEAPSEHDDLRFRWLLREAESTVPVDPVEVEVYARNAIESDAGESGHSPPAVLHSYGEFAFVYLTIEAITPFFQEKAQPG